MEREGGRVVGDVKEEGVGGGGVGAVGEGLRGRGLETGGGGVSG